MRLLLGLALAAIPCGPVFAQEVNADSQRIEMLGTSPTACVLDAPTAANAVNATFSSSGSSNGQIVINQFVDPGSANPVSSSIDLALPIICNASHQLTVRSGNGGLLRNGGSAARRQSPSTFADFVPYDLGLDWSGQSVVQSTDAGVLLISSSSARAGEAALRITTPAGGGPLVSGLYEDTIVIEFHATN